MVSGARIWMHDLLSKSMRIREIENRVTLELEQSTFIVPLLSYSHYFVDAVDLHEAQVWRSTLECSSLLGLVTAAAQGLARAHEGCISIHFPIFFHGFVVTVYRFYSFYRSLGRDLQLQGSNFESSLDIQRSCKELETLRDQLTCLAEHEDISFVHRCHNLNIIENGESTENHSEKLEISLWAETWTFQERKSNDWSWFTMIHIDVFLERPGWKWE